MSNVLIVGMGRMGMRHLRGALSAGCCLTIVSSRPEARQEALDLARATLPGFPHKTVASISECKGGHYDAAIICATADVRPSQYEMLLKFNVGAFLLEKPLCQSRASLSAMVEMACVAGAERRTWVNFPWRYAPLFNESGRWPSRRSTQPTTISVVGGALGFGCNGIHWIDLAFHLTGASSGTLLWGELGSEPIASGRGAHFRDYGGSAAFRLSDGSFLTITLDPTSAAHAVVTVMCAHDMMVLDLADRSIVRYYRELNSKKPVYLYGQDYFREVCGDNIMLDLSAVTGAWLRASMSGNHVCLPTLVDAAISHELLFCFLEGGGGKAFNIT